MGLGNGGLNYALEMAGVKSDFKAAQTRRTLK